MALGARGRTILAQVLAESVVLSVVGGPMGMSLGLVTAKRAAM